LPASNFLVTEGEVSLILRVHREQGYTIVAICDKELLGRTIVQGDLQLHISEEFFAGDEVDAHDVREIAERISTADSVVAFGEKACKALQRIYPSVSEAVVTVGGVPHVQVFRTLIE